MLKFNFYFYFNYNLGFFKKSLKNFNFFFFFLVYYILLKKKIQNIFCIFLKIQNKNSKDLVLLKAPVRHKKSKHILQKKKNILHISLRKIQNKPNILKNNVMLFFNFYITQIKFFLKFISFPGYHLFKIKLNFFVILSTNSLRCSLRLDKIKRYLIKKYLFYLFIKKNKNFLINK